jgi:hypothetical protein
MFSRWDTELTILSGATEQQTGPHDASLIERTPHRVLSAADWELPLLGGTVRRSRRPFDERCRPITS